ncbi:sel1 repeat family protein, partial [Pseudomonas aeruginosa]
RFPNLIKDHPLPPHPTQGYDVDRPDWKPER